MDELRLFRIAARVAATQLKRDLEWWKDACHDPAPEEAPKYWRKDIPDNIYIAILNEKREAVIKWCAPDIEEASSKFQKIAEELGLDVADMQAKASCSYLTELAPLTWAMMANSDSWAIESMEEAEIRAAVRDEDLQPALNLIAAGKKVPAPIVFILGDGTPYLATGNDKLMIARVMGVVPQVFLIDMAATAKSSDMPEMPVTGYRNRQGPVPAR